ncbi:helix-turn-helix domain-containing protein [Phaeobacter gallaeciensis]|uniref:helix-turn-helix domain-containing protein n=1 Tax=Phaeobacter gallaeciensis TaxID=60890 RepID=UPI00237FD3CD|nr:helix-turn-helix transcriptional regulator [Phaeobacter gallaeciensis]MDE4189636.1 helix-turn-helix transcriptional regulator [Phaeobacter gallaeciensis]MDE4198788.1 helix-turn-helix transcriptional regulator [Phaeobacter gallaeciensis]MDE4202933.1 helix-turn-helix transcriptional regulator [Phaeobacter gallaeciensis]MDE4207077.1 helix-turn-helix transcriptional regulator [Phaeobacter gallaeciensis]MDE4215698.1 helix-turn-helix transcriptional regulator [Phaeobacter gallaeciensis]
MPTVHDKIRKLMQDRGLNERQLAAMAGIKYTTFNSALNNNRKLSFETIDAISGATEVDIRYFSRNSPSLSLAGTGEDPVQKKAMEILDKALQTATRKAAYHGSAISLETFLDWWFANNGRLEGFGQLSPFVDLFHKPTAETLQIQPRKTAPNSLASICFDVTNPDQLKQTLDGFSETANRQLVEAHLEAIKRGEPILTHPRLDETLRDGSRFTRTYRRVLAPVTLADGTVLVANYSQDLQPAP